MRRGAEVVDPRQQLVELFMGVLGGGLTGPLGIEPEATAQGPGAPAQDIPRPDLRLVEDGSQLGDAVRLQVQVLEAATEEVGAAGEVVRGQRGEGGQDAPVDPLGIGQGTAVDRGGGPQPGPVAGGFHRSPSAVSGARRQRGHLRARGSRAGPWLDGDYGDAVLGRTLDDAVAVGEVDEHIAPRVVKAHYLHGFEDQGGPLLEHFFSIGLARADLVGQAHGADLAAGDGGVGGILRDPDGALEPPGLGPTQIAGDAGDGLVIEDLHQDLVAGPEPFELGVDGPDFLRYRRGEEAGEGRDEKDFTH